MPGRDAGSNRADLKLAAVIGSDESIRQHASDVVEDKLEGLIDQFYYISGDYDNAGFYETIKIICLLCGYLIDLRQ